MGRFFRPINFYLLNLPLRGKPTGIVRPWDARRAIHGDISSNFVVPRPVVQPKPSAELKNITSKTYVRSALYFCKITPLPRDISGSPGRSSPRY